MNYNAEQEMHTIEIDGSYELDEAGWTFKKIGWLCFLFIVIAGSLSLFGTAILSHQKIETSGNMVEYERYGRFGNDVNMHFLADSENGQAAVYIPQQYAKQFEVEQFIPAPDKQFLLNGHYVYTFLTDGPVHILVRGVPKKKGTIETTLRINNTRFDISQYIFP